MKTKKIFLFTKLLVGACVLNSCYTPPPIDIPKCKGNCVDVVIAGRLYTKPDSQPIVDIPLEISFAPKQGGTGFRYLTVAEVKSDKNGFFRVQTTIDSSLFERYSLRVTLLAFSTEGAFICESGSTAAGIYFDGSCKDFFTFDRGAIANIGFEFRYFANLTIRMLRTTTDSIESLFVLGFPACGVGGIHYNWTHEQEPLQPIDSFSLRVGANAYAEISVGKKVFGKETVIHTDTIFYKRNYKNIYTINF